jgi:hypothetical protein
MIKQFSFQNPKAQTTLILMVFVLIIFLGIVIVLLSFAKTISLTEYLNFYTHSLLVSSLAADVSGPDCPNCWQDVNCKTTADLLKCSIKSPSYICRSSSKSCQQFAQEKLEEIFNQYEQVKGLPWLILITAEGFVPAGGQYQFIPSEQDILQKDIEYQQLLNWTKWTARLPGRPPRPPKIDVLTANEIVTISPGTFIRVMLVIKK